MWWKKILTGWPKLWLVLCLLPGMCLKTQAETLCFSGDVPVPEGVAPEVALQPEFLGAYLMYRGGEVNLGDSVFSSFGDIPLKCETPAPNKYATCEHFGASSASGAIYQPPDPYTYSIVFREIKAVGTLCQADGTCTTHEYLSAHAGCVSSTYTPYTLALSGSSHTVDKDLTPIDLTAQVLIGGHPIIDRKVDVQMSDLGANGYLRCGMGCNGWRTDNDGRMRLQYVPGKRSAEPITFTATCPGCGNAAKWKVTSQRALLIGFFNGVANSRDAAQMSLDRLKREFGPMHHETKLVYDWFYNQTACGDGVTGKPSCLEDVAEVFEQRTAEMNGVFVNRWETFWDILAGRHHEDASLTGRLLGLLGAGGNALLQWLDATASAAVNQLVSGTLQLLTLFTHAPTYENQANHLAELTRYADEGTDLLLIAHSQGNLFVNSAHDSLRAARPDATAKVVHIAPASPTLRGDYVLASIDLVINALRLTGANSVPPANITIAPSKSDPSGHGFGPTYLDTTRGAYARTRSLISQSLDALIN